MTFSPLTLEGFPHKALTDIILEQKLHLAFNPTSSHPQQQEKGSRPGMGRQKAHGSQVYKQEQSSQ
jgi:hypothetical protein